MPITTARVRRSAPRRRGSATTSIRGATSSRARSCSSLRNRFTPADSESAPHFRIKVTLWDLSERELNVDYVLDQGDPAVSKLPDRKTQIESQLALTRRTGSVSVRINYEDVSWLTRKHVE